MIVIVHIKIMRHTYLNPNFSWFWIKGKSKSLPSLTSDAKLKRKWTKLNKPNGESSIIIKRIIGADFTVRGPLEL